MNNYIFFTLPANIRQGCNLDFQIVISSKVENFRQLLWKIVSLGRMKRYCVMDGSNVIATADVMPKIFIFSFMRGGVHIGPCFTLDGYRNRGVYTNLLKKICNDYLNCEKYIFCSVDNIASKRGILKAGFSSIKQKLEFINCILYRG